MNVKSDIASKYNRLRKIYLTFVILNLRFIDTVTKIAQKLVRFKEQKKVLCIF
jgi:hypothetical protein